MIIDGYVYAGVPPLYKITLGKDTYIYLKDEAALEKFKVEHQGKKYTVNRLKGLGEMSAEETMILADPDQRVIKQISANDIDTTNILFDQLMGTNIIARKRYVKEHSHEATYAI